MRKSSEDHLEQGRVMVCRAGAPTPSCLPGLGLVPTHGRGWTGYKLHQHWKCCPSVGGLAHSRCLQELEPTVNCTCQGSRLPAPPGNATWSPSPPHAGSWQKKIVFREPGPWCQSME